MPMQKKTNSRSKSFGKGRPGKPGRPGQKRFVKRRGFRRFKRKTCKFCADKSKAVDYKNLPLLERFVTERGKVVPSRITGLCATHQRVLASAIKRARHIALLAYTKKP